ncbi:CHAT domain-containing protein [Neolewinella sp.]|uniref:CHAT domain-containing protein n=1 Tax=Neolewinella sp. TaxID=2993543 RepID=UPI003B51B59F
MLTPIEDQQSLSYLHHSLARNQLHLGNLPAAETHLRIAEADVPPGDLLYSHNAKLRALLLAASGKPAPALKFFNTAVALLDSSGTYESDLLVVHPPAAIEANLDLLALHLTDRAAFLADQGRYRDALRDYETILQIRERLRRDVSSRGSRERLSTNLRPLLDDAIDVCYRLYKQGEEEMAWQALQFSEWARAYDLLRSYRGGGAANVETELWNKIAKLERQVVTDSTLQAALSDARLRLDRLVRRQGIHDTTALQPLDHDRLLNYLSQHHARLLLYHLTDSSAYRFALAEDGQLALERLPLGAELTEAVIQWRTDIASSAYRRKSMRQGQAQEELDHSYLTDGQQLADKLDLRASAVPTILIPDGILHALPFAALPLGQATTHALHYASVDYLGDHAPLSFGYSIATLLAQEEIHTDTYSLDLLAFAPAFAPNTLPVLPLSHEEAVAVCDHYTSHELLVDGEANRTNFTTLAPGARILHLSTHGSADLENPNLSYVAFTQTGGPSDPDERLYYNELSALHLSAELVVLSACETSIGKPVPGETVASLATAFAAAGAHSTLTTLWQVDERATLELVRHFYDRLAQGDGRQEALYYAQQRLRHSADYAHPYYWAGLSLHGSIGPLATNAAPAAPPYWLPVAVLLVAAGIGLALRAKRNSHAEQRTAPVQ